jgi:hypothetical protein
MVVSTTAYRLWDGERRRSIYTRGFAWQVREANPFLRHLERYASRATGDQVDRAVYVAARTFSLTTRWRSPIRAASAAGLVLRHPFLESTDGGAGDGTTDVGQTARAYRHVHASPDADAQLPPRLLPPPCVSRHATRGCRPH